MVLHPPSSVHLYDRVSLGNVVLENGDLLIPSWWARVRYSTSAVGGLILILLALSYRPLTSILRRVFPFHAGKRPRDLVWLLACLNLPFLALLGLPHVELMPVFDEGTRIPFVMIVSLALVAGLTFGKLRDWVLSQFPVLQESWLSHRFLLPPVYLLYTMTWFVAFVLAFANLVIMQPRLVVDAAKGATDDGPRILCVGGSVTRGAPFEEDGGVPSFPDLLEARLHDHGRKDTTVFNRGVDAAGIGYVADHLRANLELFRPTHLVVTAVANDFYRQPADYAVDVDRVLTEAKRFGVKQILLVKELEVELVYGSALANRSLYTVLDQAAAHYGATVVDPGADFRTHRNEFLFMDWVHLTVRGNSLMAEVLAHQLQFE